MKKVSGTAYTIYSVATAMIGYTIHGSLFWSITDIIFCPLVWCKWLICHQVNLSIIEESFRFFLK